MIALCETWLGGSLTCSFLRQSAKIARAMVLLAHLLALSSKHTTLSAWIVTWVKVVRSDMFSSGVFVPYFRMLILSLFVLELGT